MDLNNNYKSLLLVAVVVILVFFSVYKRKTLSKNVNKWHFSGAVDNIRYDVKKYPWVTVDGYEYNLYYTIWDFNVKIGKGDTLIKQTDDLRIKLIRQGTHDTISFNKRVMLSINDQ
ncbi:hypothetical protein HDF24_07595 [Mucilaginibacter sp. X4EP1]|uniref:hypothetical protein n=1 Tax=Mucilaginibacter sp. X4EP1 TaxID=2723092 RepID=UPI00216742F8|nr:hypothetical protein [Mucilaginibacter sp. X4EP1]MCS3814178.1 hypothetical protein [Mucilaginibacter sp. X4EP1]